MRGTVRRASPPSSVAAWRMRRGADAGRRSGRWIVLEGKGLGGGLAGEGGEDGDGEGEGSGFVEDRLTGAIERGAELWVRHEWLGES